MPSSVGWFGSGTTSHLSASDWRNIFTTLFLVLNFLIAFIGHRLVRRQGHRTLLKSKPVPVSRFTPWMSLGSTISYIWTLKRIPGGWLGLIMIFSGLFGTGNRYIINSCIVQEDVVSSCPFESGIVTTANTKMLRPVSTWAVTWLALNSLDTARERGAEVGVYSKVNNNITAFFPGEEDVLGNWDCEVAVDDTTIQPGDWANNILDDFIQNQTFLPGEKYWSGSNTPSLNVGTAFMAWGPYTDPATNQSSVRAMISTPPTVSGIVVAPANISNLECKLSITDHSKWEPAPWPVNPDPTESTYQVWAKLMVGFVLEVGAEEYPYQLTKVLNAMSMLSGTGNEHNMNQEAAKSFGAGTHFGCLVPNTRIYSSVYIITVILISLVVIMLIVDVYDIVRNKFDDRNKEVKKMPFEMLDWQVALVEKMTGDTIAKPRKLAGYEYFWDESTARPHCRKVNKRGTVYESVENPAGSASSDPSLGENKVVVTAREK
ncbi:hypothetical protein BKA65DRAFT_165697 [Rhexocercosporidium sp. MPI-PUGE-AT-0058]|nr:hypothetical protein BKA65DRAFT_165697 [Rhexocercosporidium sp. MPI-PUGE-AT-0058]